jgi:hypothetical protein
VAKLVHELLPERGAALFEQLGASVQRGARGPLAKSPAAELREHVWVPKTCATWADGLRDAVGSVT